MPIPIPKTVFSGRKIELEQIERKLGRPERGRKGAILWGLSGYGKTQLALHYITMHKPSYGAILWIDSSSADSVHDSFAQVLSKLGINVNEEQSAVEIVLEWLEQDLNRSWIIVFDGVDGREDPNEPDYIDLRKYIPSCDHGHVLLTTISSDLHLRLDFAGIQVNGVDEQAGSEIVLRWSGSSISSSSGIHPKHISPELLFTDIAHSPSDCEGNFAAAWRSASCLGTSGLILIVRHHFSNRIQSAIRETIC
jgi:hypothetical protein